MPRIITTESNRATQINWYTQVPRKARRVDRKIRVVFVSGAGNTNKSGMFTASTQPANYVDLHKPMNNLNLYADSSALPRPVPSVGSLPHCLGNEGCTSRPCASSQVGVSPTSPRWHYTRRVCQFILCVFVVRKLQLCRNLSTNSCTTPCVTIYLVVEY